MARSFSDAAGSWNTIWMLRMTSRSRLRGILPEMRTPLYWISPAAQGFTRMTARPMVVLPEPDSPTSEKVSPL